MIKEALELHKQLNPLLYKDDQLKEDVEEALIRIANEFVNQLKEEGIPLNVIDVWIVGSNASFNYSSTSDIDLHIIVNNEDLSIDKSIMQILYNYAKSSFNKNYDIKVKGLGVEVYLEDVNTTSVTNGIYSVLYDEWIKYPQPIEIPNIEVRGSSLYNNFYSQYLGLEDSEIEDFIDRLYMLRKSSLAQDGEFGLGNLVFKELRNQGILDELKEKQKNKISRELTLERLGVPHDAHR